MKYFHEYYSKDQTIKFALSEAKRKYLNEATTKNIHPFYWAGFIQIGNSTYEKSQSIKYFWFIILLSACFLLFLFIKHNYNKSQKI